jgi:hypothetical protein
VRYIDENLLPDEYVVYRADLHWIIFVPPFVAYRTTELGVTNTGTGGVREIFHRVRDPLELRRRIHGQVA